MKKFLLLSAAFLALQAVPAFAEDGGMHHKGEGLFEMQDANKDGTVSEEEFVNFGKQKFGEMDANKDGKLTKEEGKAHRDAMRAKWKEKREHMKKEGAGDVKPAPEAAPAE